MFTVCVLSAHLGNFEHIDSYTPDTAACHVQVTCGWRFTVEGYLKGPANCALFPAPINSMCFSASLCVVQFLDVCQSMPPCCLSFVFRRAVELVVLMHTVPCDFSPLPLHPRGSHVTVLYHDDEGEENAGSGNLQGGSSTGRYPYHFLSFSLSFFCCMLCPLFLYIHVKDSNS